MMIINKKENKLNGNLLLGRRVSLMSDIRVVIVSPHSRNDALEKNVRELQGVEVLRLRTPSELNFFTIADFAPRFVFFPHWSWKIPAEIYERFECVIFHMTDLPYGRGGSPLQNLIVRGYKNTKLSAIRCVKTLDAGPVYMKCPLSLLGTAEEVLLRAANITEEMIKFIIHEKPIPVEQSGVPTKFRRRLPKDGDLANLTDLEKIYDFIRMLDADGYPPAFIETHDFRFEFSGATLNADDILAEVKITRRIS
jgi:methionyl-tRNA formyltransferase